MASKRGEWEGHIEGGQGSKWYAANYVFFWYLLKFSKCLRTRMAKADQSTGQTYPIIQQNRIMCNV